MNGFQIQKWLGLDRSGLGFLVIKYLHLGRSAGQLPTGVGTEILKHLLAFRRFRIKFRCLGVIGNSKMYFFWLDAAVPPSIVGDFIEKVGGVFQCKQRGDE